MTLLRYSPQGQPGVLVVATSQDAGGMTVEHVRQPGGRRHLFTRGITTPNSSQDLSHRNRLSAEGVVIELQRDLVRDVIAHGPERRHHAAEAVAQTAAGKAGIIAEQLARPSDLAR